MPTLLLPAGKGVIVAETREQAEAAIDDMLVANKFGAAGADRGEFFFEDCAEQLHLSFRLGCRCMEEG